MGGWLAQLTAAGVTAGAASSALPGAGRGPRAGGAWRGLAGVEFQARRHELEQGLPTGEEEVARQGLQIVEESLAGDQFGADLAIERIAQIEHGVVEEGEDVQHDQHQGEVLLAVAEVVLQVTPYFCAKLAGDQMPPSTLTTEVE